MGIGSSITLADLVADPYPIFASLRANEPVAWVPAANRYFVTRFEHALHVERNPQIFSSVERNSFLERAIGPMMLRLDGAAHKRLRGIVEPKLRAGAIRKQWAGRFDEIVQRHITRMLPDTRADLVAHFAWQVSAECLSALLGLRNAGAEDLNLWSQCVIEGSANYADDPRIWERNAVAFRRFDAVVREMIEILRSDPDESILSAMIHEALTLEEIKSNLLVIIGGGINEPRDAMATALFGLLTHPEQLARALKDDSLWMATFDEAVRWVAPIGMYPRQTTVETELGGIRLETGARIGVLISSANRDEAVFERPNDFDILRPKKAHLAFGGGAHFCLGAWSARTLVAESVLPSLFRRLPGLRLDPVPSVDFTGWVFRGPTQLPLRWDAS
jgi:cytochrome P450